MFDQNFSEFHGFQRTIHYSFIKEIINNTASLRFLYMLVGGKVLSELHKPTETKKKSFQFTDQLNKQIF